ncbi:uncharacterized protein LOC115878055 [Sitophilus oryzae]|uniref:Uncharacterized protein LOC115878055 n=1 Tax=Sitophilus oryzae TaxID=7048 RepID=A0A6J2XHV1_SITOR|nr:uncharacterized protein LOC115878055 [Sitophilus oryzae]
MLESAIKNYTDTVIEKSNKAKRLELDSINSKLSNIEHDIQNIDTDIAAQYLRALDSFKTITNQKIDDLSNDLGDVKGVLEDLLLNKAMGPREQVVRELHKPARIKFKRRRFIQYGLDDTSATDLAQLDQYSRENKGYKYILVVIDCFSKYLWAKPVKSKSAPDITKAMEIILKSSNRIPKSWCRIMAKVLQQSVSKFDEKIQDPTLQSFTLNGNHKWLELLNKVTEDYNDTKHRTIGMKPKNVDSNSEKKLLDGVYSHIKVAGKSKFKVGDTVRISKQKHLFEKGYTPNWTTELFKVSKVKITNPVTYLLEDYQGNPISGGFYEEELQKTKQPEIYLVEQVLKKKGNKILVKWLGFDKSHNSWIDKSKDIV